MSATIDVVFLSSLPSAFAEIRRELVEVRAELADARAEIAKLAPDAERLITLEEAAEIVGTSVAALRKRVQRGRLPVVRQGRSLRVRRGDLAGGAR